MQREKTQPVTIRLTGTTRETIRQYAKQSYRTEADYIRRVVERHAQTPYRIEEIRGITGEKASDPP